MCEGYEAEERSDSPSDSSSGSDSDLDEDMVMDTRHGMTITMPAKLGF